MSDLLAITQATSANPAEVKRIITLGLPFTTHHGGQILFSPADGYMYFAMGDGGSVGDPWNFAQNKKSLLGKILRVDVNTMPSKSTRLTTASSVWFAVTNHSRPNN